MRRKIYGCICGLLCLCIAGCGTDTMKQSDSNIENEIGKDIGRGIL